jgi:hypothetical protein
MPISWREKIVLFKIESSYGVDPVPTGAANAMLVTNARLTPMEGNDVSRDLDTGYMGAQPTIPAELHAKLEFRVELQGSGAAGTPPAWGPLLRACAMAETISAGVSVTYNPVSTGHESGAFYFYVGDTLYKIGGARGTASVEIDAQGIPYLMFSFTGLYSAPAEDTRPAPDLTAFQKPLLATSANTPTFTIGGTAFVMRRFKFDLGNEVQNRFLIGAEAILITDRSEAVEATVEAVPLTTFDPYALAAAQSALALSLVHGTEAGKIATLSAPAAQIQRPRGLENAQNVLEWPLRLVPLPVAGNDQFTLTLT